MVGDIGLMCMSNKLGRFGSEEEFLKFLDAFFPNKGKGVVIGRGDDCSLIKTPGKILISSDIFLEGVHFDKRYFSPYAIGYKSLAVNISDIISMGGRALGFNMCLMLTKRDSCREFFNDFFNGMKELCDKYDIYLAGGDISFAQKFCVDITIWGEPGKRIFQRKRSKVGDKIFITGPIGLSRAGLIALSQGIQGNFPESVEAHLTPYIPVKEAEKIVKNPYVNTLMDVSDGIFKDIYRLIRPGQGAELEIPIKELHNEVIEMAHLLKEDPVIFAGIGGEDYVLMGSCREEGIYSLKEEIPGLLVIGRVTDKGKFLINGQQIKGGFDHFGGMTNG